MTVIWGAEELEKDIVDKLEDLRESRRREAVRDDGPACPACIAQDVEGDDANRVAVQLSEILKDQFEGKSVPEEPSPENIEDFDRTAPVCSVQEPLRINEIDPPKGLPCIGCDG